MFIFLGILAVLMITNVVLLIFSVNGSMDNFRKTFRKISEIKVIKFPLSAEHSDTKYKKAI